MLPPQLRPSHLDLDSIVVELDTGVAPARQPVGAVIGVLIPVAVAVVFGNPVLFALAVVVGAVLLGVALRKRTNPSVQLTLTRGRLKIDDHEWYLADIVGARWVCDAPRTRLVLTTREGEEVVAADVLRRGRRTPGVTRKQRDYILDVITRELDEEDAAVPDALRAIVRQEQR